MIPAARYSHSLSPQGGRVRPTIVALAAAAIIAAAVWTTGRPEIRIHHGRFIHNDRVVWGYGQYSAQWRGGRRPNITRNAPGEFGPNRTEDLGRLVENMVEFGYPALEHHFGLWYDRRRDDHDKDCRTDDRVVPPFLEQPWARSEQGMACDGLPLYDLVEYNDWYFARLREFAHQSDQRGAIFLNNHFTQHPFLENPSHYVDHPFRPGNSLNVTLMPKNIPAANAFYDLGYEGKNDLQRRYIRKVLDELGEFQSVFHFTSEEFTGTAEFVKFWMDTIVEWEGEVPGRDVKIGLSAPKGVIDEVLEDPIRGPHVDGIDLKYFWYDRGDGSLVAARGGFEVPGRHFHGKYLVRGSSPEMVFRQTYEYRKRYPDKVLFHAVGYQREFLLAFMMAGGSINRVKIHYGGIHDPDPPYYIQPKDLDHFQPVLGFIRSRVGGDLADMVTNVEIAEPDQGIFSLAGDEAILVYSLYGGEFELDLGSIAGSFSGTWFDPATGEAIDLKERIPGNARNRLSAPDNTDWLLLLERE